MLIILQLTPSGISLKKSRISQIQNRNSQTPILEVINFKNNSLITIDLPLMEWNSHR